MKLQSMTTYAQEEACGDRTVQGMEQCDDGNTASGDGCSSVCTIERCGNGVVDAREQCDDGNTVSGDGCSLQCFHEFCGDGLISIGLKEQCDDGNTVSGDGCSSDCRTELNAVEPQKEPAIQPSSRAPLPTRVQPTPSVILRTPKEVMTEVKYFLSQAGKELLQTIPGLTPTDVQSVQGLLSTLSHGGRLNEAQQTEANRLNAQMSYAAENARATEETSLTSLLSGPAADNVLKELSIDPQSMKTNDPNAVLATLQGKVQPMGTEALKAEVKDILADLQKNSPNSFERLPKDLIERLSGTPSETLAVLAVLKENVDQASATTQDDAAATINEHAQALVEEISTLKEIGINENILSQNLSKLTALTADPKPQDASKILALGTRVLQSIASSLETNPAILTQKQGDNATRAERIADALNVSDVPVTTDALKTFATSAAAGAPREYSAAFRMNNLAKMGAALKELLSKDTEIQATLKTLREKGERALPATYDRLLVDLGRLGAKEQTPSRCDDDVDAAMNCVQELLKDLQANELKQATVKEAAKELREFFHLSPKK